MNQRQANEKFINDTLKKCKENGVKIIMPDTSTVNFDNDNTPCAGYFCSDEKVLAVAAKVSRESFYGLLAHESSHMEQWLDDTYLWEKCSYGYSLFFEWLGGKIVKREQLEEAVQDIIRLELDCEKRTLKKIEKYKLPINRRIYIQKTNTYLFGYLYMLEKRKWIAKIYNKKSIYGKASGFLKKQYNKVPLRLHRAFTLEFGNI